MDALSRSSSQAPSRLGYQMARTPVLPIFAADLGATPELIGVIVAASTITGVFFKLPSGALSDVLGRKRMMVLGAVFFAAPPFLYPFVHDPGSLLALACPRLRYSDFLPGRLGLCGGFRRDWARGSAGLVLIGERHRRDGGPLIGGFVLYFTASYSVTYLLVGVLGVLTLFVVLLLPDADRQVRQVKTLAARTAEFRQGAPRCSGPRRTSSRPASKPSCISATVPFSAFFRSPRRHGLNDAAMQSSSAHSWPWPWWRSRSLAACLIGSAEYLSSSVASSFALSRFR